jgi:ABC-type sugar transport system substrate-binding protein
VVFINPGPPSDMHSGPMPRAAADFMTAAAADLGVELELLHSRHDHLAMIGHAESLAARAEVPDYVVLVNDKMAAPAMLQALKTSRARLFVIHSDVTDEQRSTLGNEREAIANWIGSATADSTRGVYRLMAELHAQLEGAPLRAVGITGPSATPVSQERARGFADYVASVPGARVEQLAYGDWSMADGERKAAVLLARYPETTVLWAANDEMAVGGLSAARARGTRMMVGGMGGWQRALESIEDGGMGATLVGGHMIGAWAMVMLYDYHHGIDFANDGGLRRRLDYLLVVSRSNVQDYKRALSGAPISFKRYSKAHNRRRARYDFGLDGLLSGAGPR